MGRSPSFPQNREPIIAKPPPKAKPYYLPPSVNLHALGFEIRGYGYGDCYEIELSGRFVHRELDKFDFEE